MSVKTRFANAFNAFFNKDPTKLEDYYEVYDYPEDFYFGPSYSYRPDLFTFTKGQNKTIVGSIYNRIALDVSLVSFVHSELDEEKRYKNTIQSGLNRCLSMSANLDQTGTAFIMDLVLSMFDEGHVAVVPIDYFTDEFGYITDIESLRTGKIETWYPDRVKISVYNEILGKRQDITMLKKDVGIIENPFYSIMNEENSTLKRLIRKLALLDMTDDKVCSGKLNLLLQLPYTIKNGVRRSQAEARTKELETQLATSKYGIGYIDGTEKVTQLNGSIDNSLIEEINNLTAELYNQLGLTSGVFDGTASESEQNNYQQRTVQPILSAITTELTRKFILSEKWETEKIISLNDPFKHLTTNNIAEIADKFTRNEILTANEIRQMVGIKPAQDPNADVLRNRNITQPKDQVKLTKDGEEIPKTIEVSSKEA